MNIGLDGINLGPLTVNWTALTLIAGLLTWFTAARFEHAERAAVTLDGSRPLIQNVLDIVDVRRGGWAWLPGVVAGLLALWWPTRRSRPAWAPPCCPHC